MIRLNDILEEVSLYIPDGDLDLIKKAYIFSARAHKGQIRLSGEPYLSHPLEVAGILAKLKLDVITISAGLLHDTIEDTLTTYDELQKYFGEEIAMLVDGVTKIGKMSFHSRHEEQAENFRKMILAMAKDIRVILIKLADRLHNMRTLEFMDKEKQELIAQETLDIYAPLAHRVGIFSIKGELEDLSLRFLKPDVYYDLAKKVMEKKKEREKFIEEAKKIISLKLEEYGIKAEITGRPKHFYSIYQKMATQNLDFDQVYDLLALRIIVNTVRECYEVLGIIHSLWKPIPGRIKDYIAIPKANMYQSLHTTVVGPYGKRLEIQIRTEDMHRVAEYGIAAHWKYKEGKVTDSRDEARFTWLRQLLEWQRELKDPAQFMETLKVDLFPEEVFVFTPKGDVKALPRGSTPIDFAYAIHTELGHHCQGAKVNGRIVPLKYELKSGDMVEIIASPTAKPSKDWLKIVKTSRAKTRIRQFINQEERERGRELGKGLLEKELRRYGSSISKFQKEDLDRVVKEFSFKSFDDLIIYIGYGKISAHQVAKRLVPPEKLKEVLKQEDFIKKGGRIHAAEVCPIKIRDIDDVLVRFAKCCSPLPGDSIVGFITRGRGVTVHNAYCSRVLESDPERRVEVEWDEKLKMIRSVKVKVVCMDRPGLLAELSKAISSQNVNIRSAQIKTLEDKKAVNYFELDVENLQHLNAVIKSLEKIKEVIHVERVLS